MFDDKFIQQVKLLLMCMPVLRDHDCFAIKGGTAINLLIRNMPRLSVDIDLTYHPLANRKESIEKIQNSLEDMALKIQDIKSTIKVKKHFTKNETLLTKLFVYDNATMIKIEINSIMRGCVYPIEKHELTSRANEMFGAYINNVPSLSEADLYAGKICAALDRQHPRDLFDIIQLMENGGITEKIRQAFVVYLACNSRPMHELLSPNRLNIEKLFNGEFSGMTDHNVSLSELIDVREQLINHIQTKLTDNERKFLLSIKNGEPIYSLMPFTHLSELPGLKWKLINIQKMNKSRKTEMAAKLKIALGV